MVAVHVSNTSLEAYESIIGEAIVEEIKVTAERLSGKSVCHVNSTSFGGGVAEILHRLVPLMQDARLNTEWKVIEGSHEFFDITKTIHNGLQGMNIPFTEQMKRTYLQCNEMNAYKIDLDHDFVVIHDNQPAAIIYYRQKMGKWIWRCHIDLSTPNQGFINFITPLLLRYDSLIFTMKQYIPKRLGSKKIAIIPPSIDPLSDKNKPISEGLALSILNKFDIDSERPIIAQVARFDPWKDPLGVIDVYRLIKRKVPDVQLLLISSMAKDDPEGWVYYEKTARYAAQDYDIHLLTNLKGVGDIEVNAFQRTSDVILQKSIREGFGLTVAEALWKETPVVGSNVGGISLQIIHGKTGFLVNSSEEAAEKTLYLLKHPTQTKEIGRRGKEHVLKNFLITKHLLDYLKFFVQLESSHE